MTDYISRQEEREAKIARYNTATSLPCDYISRQAAIDYPLSWEHYDKENGSRKFIYGVESYREYIEYLPAADVVEVVRCKDCKHHNNETEFCKQWSIFGTVKSDDDDFCSYGERAD